MVATRRTSRRIQNQNGDDTDASVEFIEISDAEVSTPMKTPRRATRSTTSTPVKQSTAVSTPSTATRRSTRVRSTPARNAKKTATEVIEIDDEPEVTPAKTKALKTPTPVKRGRGRPRKNLVVSETESVQEVIFITEESAQEEEEEEEEQQQQQRAKSDQMAILKTIREEQAEEEEKKQQEQEQTSDGDEKEEEVKENQTEENLEKPQVVVSDPQLDKDTIQMKDNSEEQEEKDEIPMPDDEEEDNIDLEEHEKQEEQEEEDDEIMNFVMIASSGLDIKKSSPPQISVSSNKKQLNIKTTAHALLQGLDSGYSKANSYFKYDETNQEVKLVAEKAINEEKNKLKQQIEVATRGKIQQQISKTKTTGSKWFDMSSHELTEDVKRDFALLRMRNYLDPKKFYKSTDHKKNLPKHFQIGTVIEGAHEYKSARIARKDRCQTFTDEIMADSNIRQYTKRVYSQIQRANHGQGRKKKQNNKKIRF